MIKTDNSNRIDSVFNIHKIKRKHFWHSFVVLYTCKFPKKIRITFFCRQPVLNRKKDIHIFFKLVGNFFRQMKMGATHMCRRRRRSPLPCCVTFHT